MIPREILKKIRQIELRTNRLVSETLGGQYHSVFKGQGMNFEEVREYQPGDEVRSIDWNVTARDDLLDPGGQSSCFSPRARVCHPARREEHRHGCAPPPCGDHVRS